MSAAVSFADCWTEYPRSPYDADLRVVNSQLQPGLAEPRRTKVCIIGAGMGRYEAPLESRDWEVWALNMVPPIDQDGRLRCDVWFDLHQRVAQNEKDLKWLAACPYPLYVPDDLMDVNPRTVRFPLREVEAAYGEYWSCTFAFQIALILLERRVTDIGLYGVELAYGTLRERTVEWACVSYWLGRAEERGLRIHLPFNTTLLTHPARYGFEYQAEIDGVKRYTQGTALPEIDAAGTLKLPSRMQSPLVRTGAVR